MEATAVDDFLSSASRGPSALVIEGDAGIGKTAHRTCWHAGNLPHQQPPRPRTVVVCATFTRSSVADSSRPPEYWRAALGDLAAGRTRSCAPTDVAHLRSLSREPVLRHRTG